MEHDELMESLREKEGYREMERVLGEIVRTRDLIPRIELLEMRDRLAGMRDASQRDVFIHDLRYRLVQDLIAMVVDKDKLKAEELVFMMAMVEDIAGRLVEDYIDRRLARRLVG